MLQQEKPDDYVIASGEAHSVREFVEHAYRCIDIELEWDGKGENKKGIDKKTGKTVIKVSPELFRPADVNALVGDYSKAKEKLGWHPKTRFEELVGLMVDADIKLLEREGSA